MIRTKHTCEIINVNNIPVIYDERLMERIGGKLTNTVLDDYYYTDYYNYYSTNIVEGLETLPELFKRVHSLLDEIKEKYKDKNILLVTHGAVARTMQFYFEPIPEDRPFIAEFIKAHKYTIEEKLINLCDLMCPQGGKVYTIDKRLIDIMIRRGAYSNTQYHIKENL